VVKRLDAKQVRRGIVIPTQLERSPIRAKSSRSAKARSWRMARCVRSTSSRRPHSVREVLRQAVKVEGTEYLVMREDDIMGVVATK